MNRQYILITVILVVLIGGAILWSAMKSEKEKGPQEEYCTKKDTGESMSLTEAKQIALTSECGEQGNLKDTYMCNEYTGTWWIDLTPYTEKELCNPACVVNVITRQAEINWRCTGVLP